MFSRYTYRISHCRLTKVFVVTQNFIVSDQRTIRNVREHWCPSKELRSQRTYILVILLTRIGSSAVFLIQWQ